MEKLSRVKKYEDLRKSIELDNHVDSPLTKEETIANTEKEFDSSLLKRVAIKSIDEESEAKRAKQDESENDSEQDKHDISDTFTNEYLDDFIREVREYNIRKGNRESEDTQADILYQLNAANRAKRSHYVQEINEDTETTSQTNSMSKADIVAEVQNLLRENEEEHVEERPIIPVVDTLRSDLEDTHAHIYDDSEIDELIQGTITPMSFEKPTNNVSIQETPQVDTNVETPLPQINRVEKKVIQPAYGNAFEDETDQLDVLQTKNEETGLHKKLIEETQQLRVQMDEYEDELTDLTDGVEKTNKLLNFVLCFLILVLLVIIGFIVYSLIKAGGI